MCIQLSQIGALPFLRHFICFALLQKKHFPFIFLFAFDCQESQNLCPCLITAVPLGLGFLLDMVSFRRVIQQYISLHVFCCKLWQVPEDMKQNLSIVLIVHSSEHAHPCHGLTKGAVYSPTLDLRFGHVTFWDSDRWQK